MTFHQSRVYTARFPSHNLNIWWENFSTLLSYVPIIIACYANFSGVGGRQATVQTSFMKSSSAVIGTWNFWTARESWGVRPIWRTQLPSIMVEMGLLVENVNNLLALIIKILVQLTCITSTKPCTRSWHWFIWVKESGITSGLILVSWKTDVWYWREDMLSEGTPFL